MKRLRKLDLSGNRIGDKGAQLVTQTALMALGARAIAKALVHQIHDLDLSDNQIGEVGGVAFARLYEDPAVHLMCNRSVPNTRLRELELNGNPLTDAVATEFYVVHGHISAYNDQLT